MMSHHRSVREKLRALMPFPLIGAPLFIISTPALVIAQCKAGVVGSFPSLNVRPKEKLEEWLIEITEALAKHDAENPLAPAAPFAVNQIVHKSNDRLEYDLQLCVKYKVPIVITSLGAREELNQTVHAYGGIVLHDVINQKFARKAIEKGADGLILVATGAGGHAGTQSPFALVQETRAWFDGPIALSGAIASGQSVLAALSLGADFAYAGSVFIATTEANASGPYKDAIVDSDAEDIVYTNLFTGVHGNYLKPSIVTAGLDPDNLPISDPSKMDFGSGGGSDKKAWRDIWGCGQGIGTIKSILSTQQLVERLRHEFRGALRDVSVVAA
jgi:nitronate monooxygenase